MTTSISFYNYQLKYTTECKSGVSGYVLLFRWHVECGWTGGADAAVEDRLRTGWNKFRQLVPLLTNNDISLKVRGRLYSSCVQSSMLYRSETGL